MSAPSNAVFLKENPSDNLPDAGLWNRACRLRRQYWGNTVFLRGIIELSNHCRQNCLYCGLRRSNLKISRYRLSGSQIWNCAMAVKRLGFGTVVLQAGEDPGVSAEDIAQIVKKIKTELKLAVTLSLGEWEYETYALWRKAGADRYLLKLETTDEALYAQMRPGRTLTQREQALNQLRDLGYEVGTGLICALPGQSRGALNKGIEKIARFRPDMLSIGPFQPHPQTPLHSEPAGTAAETLEAMAHARILAPYAHIPVTSALGLHGNTTRLAALAVGNVLMPSLTPADIRASYSIYPGKNAEETEPEQRAAQFVQMLTENGFQPGQGPGEAWRLQNSKKVQIKE
ncbi:MAG: [Desulfovibrionaceae bacterium]|nr:[FeFe] hydrogenase H-cluster radical SAM maturase HydE [Desulfovibrionaceae bacterium]